MQTRQFSAFNSKSLLIPGSAAVNAVGLKWKRADINSRTASDNWLLAFAGVAVPVDGTVPLYAGIFVPTNYIGVGIFEDGRVIPGPGLVLAMSSTPDSLTATAGAAFDITADVEEWELPAQDTTDVGDLVTNVTTRAAWNDAAGPKRLVRIQAKNTAAGTRYLQLFAQDAPAGGQIPITEWTIATGAYIDIQFGRDGRSVYSSTTAFAERDGCTLAWSTTPETLTAAAGAGAIKATYK